MSNTKTTSLIMKELAETRYNEGYSCSEAIIRAAYEAGYLNENTDIETLNRIASAFSGGMSSGCLCGAVAGSEIILGIKFGRKNTNKPPLQIKTFSKTFIDKFKEKRKATCCKALTKGLEFGSPERRQNCKNIVGDSAEILQELLDEK